MLAFRTPLQEHPVSIDGKAAGVLTMVGVMFTVVARSADPIGKLLEHGSSLRFLVAAFLAAMSGSALWAIVQAFRTISPRFMKTEHSLAFWGDVAQLPREEYIRRVTALTTGEALKEILTYNHALSSIIVRKHAKLRPCLKWFKISLFLWLALMIFVARKALLG